MKVCDFCKNTNKNVRYLVKIVLDHDSEEIELCYQCGRRIQNYVTSLKEEVAKEERNNKLKEEVPTKKEDASPILPERASCEYARYIRGIIKSLGESVRLMYPRTLTSSDIVEYLKAQGWAGASEYVGYALAVLIKEGFVLNLGEGKYRQRIVVDYLDTCKGDETDGCF